jgi:hypothetical protein
MDGPQIIRSQYKNRYGEAWEFEYDPSTGEATLRGANVDWQGIVLFKDACLGSC